MTPDERDEMVKNGLVVSWWFIIVVATFVMTIAILDACTTTVSSGPCPPLVEYTNDFQVVAAEDLMTVPEQSPLRQMMADYMRLRDMVRECQ